MIYTHITYGEGGLSLALLEVMSIGKPIIASDIGGIPEAIRHPLEGILVKNDVESIVSAVGYLLENPKLQRKMGIISRRAVNSRFSWSKTAKMLYYYFGISKVPNDKQEGVMKKRLVSFLFIILLFNVN